ncbi:hypothetical protein [Paeniglutamicibacter terrestris]|uniref:STAS domain-containing protein n=1 Tax=Paeniglutamicibacter terrestris TaxID=2723403 RepID=A0ABX1G062_9MICC|nr:hypothetical protein [Paeniglutamicibacter terrestris]NKG19429.1 hypothetical protein [Paeniglutamicibacter terrestris]
MSSIPSLEMNRGAMNWPEALPSMLHSTESRPVWTQENEHAQLTFFANELLEISFSPRTELTAPTAMELLAIANARLEHRIKYLLIDICSLDRIDVEVSRIFNSVTEGIRIALLGAGPTDRVLARFFVRKIDPLRRFTYTERRQDALAFLLEND